MSACPSYVPFYCNSTYDACLRSQPEKCTCLRTHYTCLQDSHCHTVSSLTQCALDVRRLRCQLPPCPDLDPGEEDSVGWILALVFFLLAFIGFVAALIFVAWKRGWCASNAAKKMLPKKIRGKVLGAAGDIEVLPEDVASADLVALTMLNAKRNEKGELIPVSIEKGDEEGDQAEWMKQQQQDMEKENMNNSLEEKKQELDLVNEETMKVEAELRQWKQRILEVYMAEKDKLELQLAVGTKAADELLVQRGLAPVRVEFEEDAEDRTKSYSKVKSPEFVSLAPPPASNLGTGSTTNRPLRSDPPPQMMPNFEEREEEMQGGEPFYYQGGGNHAVHQHTQSSSPTQRGNPIQYLLDQQQQGGSASNSYPSFFSNIQPQQQQPSLTSKQERDRRIKQVEQEEYIPRETHLSLGHHYHPSSSGASNIGGQGGESMWAMSTRHQPAQSPYAGQMSPGFVSSRGGAREKTGGDSHLPRWSVN